MILRPDSIPPIDRVNYTYYPWESIRTNKLTSHTRVRVGVDAVSQLVNIDEQNGQYDIVVGARTFHHNLTRIHTEASAMGHPMINISEYPLAVGKVKGSANLLLRDADTDTVRATAHAVASKNYNDLQIDQVRARLKSATAAVCLATAFLTLDPPTGNEPAKGTLVLPSDIADGADRHHEIFFGVTQSDHRLLTAEFGMRLADAARLVRRQD